ncbi:MAG: HlyD family efflux transporter periplasmic adaptor subunit [Flavobacteriales bacterium]|nr:HlyD family efflux transporter periplasmic adaptor subunit [Flavobacteriales bacterium]
MKNNRILIVLAVAVVALLVVAIILKKKGLVGSSSAEKVAVEEVAKRDITETVSASGKIQSESEVKISPDVSGEIMELPVKEGDRVEEGQLLVKIDPDIQKSNVERLEAALNTSRANLANAQSRLAQSEARLTNSKANYERVKQLFEDKVVAQSEYDASLSEYNVAQSDVEASQQSVEASRFQVKSAEASLQEAQKSLTRTEIYSPVNGTISKLNFEKGERVVGTSQMQGSEIMTIADLAEMEVVVEVNENDIIRVGYNDTCDIEVDAYLDKTFKGIVTNIANSAKSDGTGTDQITNFEVKVRILRTSYSDLVNEKQPDQSPFRPGMSATVDIRTRQVKDVLSVPIQAVTTRTKSELEKQVENREERRERRKGPPSDEGDDEEEEAIDKPAREEDAIELVFVVDGNDVVVKQVKTGIQDNEYIEVVSGVELGDRVVTAPYRAISKKLAPGDEVEVVSKDELYKSNEGEGGFGD